MNERKSFKLEEIPNLKGKVAIVTGANSGIGKQIALELARNECHVILGCRSLISGEEAVNFIKKETGNSNVEVMELDLSSLNSVLAFIDDFNSRNLPLNILINNAAVMGLPFQLTEDKLEIHFATNYLSHFLLTMKLLDKLEQSAIVSPRTSSESNSRCSSESKDQRPFMSRIVNVASSLHSLVKKIDIEKLQNQDYYPTYMTAYSISKTLNILFTKKLSEVLKEKGKQGIFVNCNDPGLSPTNLQRNLKQSNGLFGFIGELGVGILGKKPEKTCLTTLYLATSSEIETLNISGQYIIPPCKVSRPSKLVENGSMTQRVWDFTQNLLKSKLASDYTIF